MRNIWLIIQREYLVRVRKKSFLIATFLVPIVVLLLLVGVVMLAVYAQEETSIVVKDESGYFEDKFRGLDGESLRFEYIQDTTSSIVAFRKNYENNCDGILYIPDLDINAPAGIKYYSNTALGPATEATIQKALSEVMQGKMLADKGLDENWLQQLNEQVSIESVIKEETATGIGNVASSLGYIMGFLIYIYLLVFGSMVMKGISEEKTNRIVEVMLSCAKPFDMMMGKIIGIGAVGLTQMLLWAIMFFVGELLIGVFFAGKLMALQDLSSTGLEQQQLNDSAKILELVQAFGTIDKTRLLLSFLYYFICGYIFYGAQFAAIGAAVTDEGDSQQFMMPIMIPIVAAIMLMGIAIQQPESSAAWWGSMIPFTSPIVMMSRIPFGISIGQQLLSMAILAASSMLMVKFAAKIYRVGILVQGKKITFKELWKWMKMA